MAVKLKTDLSGQIEFPTLILTNRNGNRLGVIEAYDIVYSDSFLDADEFTFKTKKYWNGVLNPIWDEITDLKIIWCEEYDSSFQISVEIDEEDDTTKIVSAIKLAHSELSQIMLYNIEINTEDDIAREDYIKPTVFYNKNDKSISLLNRLLEKAPHYMIIHVDSTLCNIQRTFSFDGTSIYDAFNDIAEEIGCVFIYPNEGNAGKSITRRISVFDLYSNCKDCGYRGDFIGRCPECGSSNIINGYGEDTGIFVTSDELGQQLNVKGDIDSVKNCLRLEAGDDLMTATIKSCNPNGTQYLWNITSSTKKDMQKELSDKIDSYSKLVQDYETVKEFNLSNDNIRNYNSTIEKYQKYNNRFNKIELPIIGFNGLIETEYNILDLQLFIQTGLMPDASLSDTTAEQQIKIVEDNLKIVSVSNLKALSIASANSAILGYVKCILDNRYTATIVNTPILSNNVWNGILKITNNSDENDSGNTNSLSVEINDDYKNYVLQKVDKIINKNQVDNVSISGIFKLSLDEFKSEMKKYSIDMLVNFHDACQAVIDVLTEQGVGTKETWAGKDPNLYDDLYVPYYNKLETLEDELNSKETDLSFVSNTKSEADTYITNVHNILDFEKYLGTDLWKDFCAYRREDTYRNENFVSDGLDNKELIGKATEFYKLAKSEIFKSAEIQYSISTTLNNLLVLDKFKPIVNSFKTGNWIRVKVDDKIYKLRLLKYEIDYSNIENINVEFSTALRDSYGIDAQKAIILAAKAMSTSYNYVQKQVSKGEKTDDTVSDWKQNGLDATNTQIIGGSDYQNQIWDSHGLLLRKYDNIENKYEDNQMKIVNSTIAITNDNWETVKTAIGYYFYTDNNGELKSTYGINAETIVGKLVLGNELYFSNETNTMTFDQNGLTVSNGTNTFIVNPGDVNLLKIKKGEEDVFYVDQNGKLHITGDGTYIDVSGNEVIEGIKTDILSIQKTSHTHENKSILDKIEQPYTTAERDKLARLENYTHPTHAAHVKGFYKFASDGEGHVTDAEDVTASDLYSAGGVIQSALNLYDYIGDIPLSFMTLYYGGGLKNIAEISFFKRESNKRRKIRLCLGSSNNMSTGCLNLVDYNGCQYTLEPNPDSPGAQAYIFYFPKQSGTLALTKDIPDISGKQDKLTAGTNITISGRTISAKDTTYKDATQSAHGLMTAADKKKLDGMDLTKYLPKDGTAEKAKELVSGAMRYGSCANGTASFNDGYKWFRIGSMIPTSNGYDTETMCLQVYQGYNTYGVLGVYTRSDKTGLKSDNMNMRWFIRSSNALPSFKLVAIESSTGLAYELWCAVPQRYQQTHCTVMADIALTGGMANRWVMYTLTASDAQTATTAGAKSVTDEDLSYAAKATEATTLTDSGWSSVTTYIADKSKFNNISTEFRRIGQIAWVKCSFTPNVAMTKITICDVVNIDPFVAVTPANTVYGVGSNNDGTESFIATISYNPDRKLYLRGNFKASTIYRLMFSYPVT